MHESRWSTSTLAHILNASSTEFTTSSSLIAFVHDSFNQLNSSTLDEIHSTAHMTGHTDELRAHIRCVNGPSKASAEQGNVPERVGILRGVATHIKQRQICDQLERIEDKIGATFRRPNIEEQVKPLRISRSYSVGKLCPSHSSNCYTT